MQPFTIGEKIVTTVIMATLTFGALIGSGVQQTWWGALSTGVLVGLIVAGYTALYNAVVTR